MKEKGVFMQVEDRPLDPLISKVADLIDSGASSASIKNQLYSINERLIQSTKHNPLATDINQAAGGQDDEFTIEYYRTLVHSLSEGIVVTDLEDRIVYVNDQTCQLTGYSRNELLHERAYEVLLPQERWSEIRDKIKLRISGVSERYELTIYNKSGGRVDFLVSASPFKNAFGEIIGSIGAMVDITELKRVRKELENSSTRYRDLFNSMQEAVFIVDEHENITRCNQAALDLIEADDLKQAIGISLRDLTYKDSTYAEQRFHDKLKEQGYYQGYIGRIKTFKGAIRYIEVNSSAVHENGAFLGSREVARDITERVNNEKKVQKLLTDLQNANKELKDFAYVVAHDLKAPLRSIGSLSNWLNTDYRPQLDADGQQIIDLLIGRTERMHKLIEGVLEYSKVGKVKEDVKEVDVNRIVEQVIEVLDVPDHITIEKEMLPETLPFEKTRLFQLFQNLIGNAIKFNDKPRGEIKINYSETNAFHRFSVEDNGPGIESSHQKKVFNIFQTLHARDEMESTGIGLSIVKKIIELHGGEIWIESKPGKGTKFVFTLPV